MGDEQSKWILVIHPGSGNRAETLSCLGQPVTVRRVGCEGSIDQALALVVEHDGVADAIALEGIAARLQLGSMRAWHETGSRIVRAAKRTPVVDGSGVRASVERWGVVLAERAEPGLLSNKRVLMVPGLNHAGLAEALGRRSAELRYADPMLFLGLPTATGSAGGAIARPAVAATLGLLRRAALGRLLHTPERGRPRRARSWFRWADVLAGEASTIRGYAPDSLAGKTVVMEFADEVDIEDLRHRGVSVAVTLMPALEGNGTLGSRPASTLEALLVACRRHPQIPLTEDTYLNMISELEWTPAVRFLQHQGSRVNRFAFVVHPLDVSFIHRHPSFRWTRFLPASWVEPLAARLPPHRVGKIRGGRSPVTGTRIEGDLIALGATPRQMMRRGPEFTYRRLRTAARIAEARGARLMGLGAFTSVVGDAGVTVARQSPIAITSGNSLTVAATLEAAKQAAIRMGARSASRAKAMVIGATGSIGAVCSRMLAQAVRDVVLVSIEPEKLIDLKRLIQRETPGARVLVSTSADGLVGDCDLIVTATSGFGQRVIDISQCQPGAIICDVARPPDVSAAEAALRPDVLVIESGEVLIPGDIEFSYDIGLPGRVSYACLAETALLAMEGRFENFTLGRELRVERVKEIYRLFRKHGFQLAGLRSLGRYQTQADLAEKRTLADRLRNDPALFEQVRREASEKLATLPGRSKGVVTRRGMGEHLGDAISSGLEALVTRVGERRRSVPRGSLGRPRGLAPGGQS